MFKANTWVALVAASGVIFSAAYALYLYRRVVFGDLIKESLKTIQEMNSREKAIFAPLVVMTLLLGSTRRWSPISSAPRSRRF